MKAPDLSIEIVKRSVLPQLLVSFASTKDFMLIPFSQIIRLDYALSGLDALAQIASSRLKSEELPLNEAFAQPGCMRGIRPITRTFCAHSRLEGIAPKCKAASITMNSQRCT